MPQSLLSRPLLLSLSSFVQLEKNGEFYIVYHVHDDPADPSYQRHIVMNKVEWVTNSNGIEVMYVNGPTLASIQPLPEFASGYKNIA